MKRWFISLFVFTALSTSCAQEVILPSDFTLITGSDTTPISAFPTSKTEAATTTYTFFPETTTSQPTPSVPSPSVKGKVRFVDGVPGFNVKVLLRSNGGGTLYSSAFADLQGNYWFYNIQSGTYWINTVTNNTYIGNQPSAVVVVTANGTSEVETLIVRKDLFLTAINNITILNPHRQEIKVSAPNFTFTWTAVEAAIKYEVEVWSTYTQANPSNRDYDLITQTGGTTILWPTDLSSLPYTNFRIDVTAYDTNNMILANNYELFTIG